MNRDESLAAVCRALRDPAAVKIVQKIVRAGYHENFKEHLEAADQLVEESFGSLVGSQSPGINPTALDEVTRGLGENVFHRGEGDFWFNRLYHRYKTVTKPETDYEQVQSLIAGDRVLDYGCGSGYLAARLAKGGYDVFTTDVLDYRYNEARHLPFVRMTSATQVDYPANSIDTALAQAVLHHIDAADLGPALRGLARVATHMLIKEDTYDLPPRLEGLDEALAAQPLLRAFLELPIETQFRALVLIDYYANAVAQGIAEMNMPFQFKSPPEWERTLAQNGWRLSRTSLAGMEPGRMHKSCHIWFLCTREGWS